MHAHRNVGAAAPGLVTPGSDEAPAGRTAQGFRDGTANGRDCRVGLAGGQALRSDWHRVGAGLSVRFAIAHGRIDAEWLPRMPTKRELRRVIDRYRIARHEFLSAVAGEMGGTVVCLELAAPEGDAAS